MEPLPRRLQAGGIRRFTLALGLSYLAFGSMWIWLSDHWVAAVSTDVAWLVAAQRYKGLAYVGLTAVGIMVMTCLGARRLLALQQQVTDSDLRVQDLFMSHPQPMWVFDPHTLDMLRVNDAALARYGYSREEFLRLSARDIRPPNEVPSFVAAVRRRLQGESRPVEVRHLTRSGDDLRVRISAHLIELKGRPAMMVMAEDVTAEARLREALQRQQLQFEQLHESLEEVLWMASPDGSTVHYVSPAFATVYGRQPDALKANQGLWREVVHPEDVAIVDDVRGLDEDKDTLVCEYRIVHPDGSVRWVRDHKRVIRDDSGVATMVGGIATDITAWRERDEARATLNSRLETLVGERTRALEQANIELEAFSRTAAHDLKSPLNAIVGMAHLLHKRADAQIDATSRRYLDQIQRSARDMAHLVNDLLSLSRAGSIELDRKTVDLAPGARALLDDLKTLEPLRRVDIDMPERLEVFGDEGLLRSVLHNLIGNAWKFSAGCDPARLCLRTEHGDGLVALVVEDNGAGFDASQLGELLRPFQRFHTQAQFQGTGLGLVTCQRIAHRHGGRLVIESAPGEGTRVRVLLPLPR